MCGTGVLVKNRMKMRHVLIFLPVRLLVLFCRNGDGFIDREEFGDILHLTGEPVTEEDIDEMFGESDTNKDGKIDFDGTSQTGGQRALRVTCSAVVLSLQLVVRRVCYHDDRGAEANSRLVVTPGSSLVSNLSFYPMNWLKIKHQASSFKTQ